MHFRENIDRLMQARGLDRAGVAEVLDVPLAEVLAWKNGASPSLSQLLRLADFFGVSLDRLLRTEVRPLDRSKIKFLVVDVDGVMTDGGMYVTESGEEMKKYHTRDGRGIIELQKQGTPVGILSGSIPRQSVLRRAERLNVAKCYVGQAPKLEVLDKWLSELSLTHADFAFIGDDLNDLKVMRVAGFSACPSDACTEVRSLADMVLRTPGGGGCVREFVDHLLL